MVSLLIFLMLFTQAPLGQEYVAKQGDSVTVTVWERQSLSGTVIVDSNGNITLPMPIGSVSVVGMTAANIAQLLTDKIKEYLVNPTVFVSITPAEGFIVHVLGEVKSPDFIKVPEGSTVQEVITRAGGFTDLADKKHIKLIRKDEKDIENEKTIEIILDFEQFIEDANLSANPVLKSGDVLLVPRIPKSERITSRYITVFGAVGKPGPLEVEEPLPLTNVLALAGGLTREAATKEISILSISNDKVTRKYVDFEKFLTGEDPTVNPSISIGDMVFVPERAEEEKPFIVNIIGQVEKPGAYPMTKESRLFDALYLAGGFAEEAAIDKVTVIRVGVDSLVKEEFNVEEFLSSGDQKLNPLIIKGDTIYVPLSQDAKEISSIHEAFLSGMRISVIGEVTKPNTFQVSKNVSLLDILNLAGGPTSQADLKRVAVIREIADSDGKENSQTVNLQKVLTKGEFQLLPKLNAGDTIFVPRKTERNLWENIMKTISNISTIIVTYYLITGQRW